MRSVSYQGRRILLVKSSRAFNSHILMLLQALCGEAMQLLWALADHSPRALTGLEGQMLEQGHQACYEGSPWETVLVSHCSIVLAAEHWSLRRRTRVGDASRLAFARLVAPPCALFLQHPQASLVTPAPMTEE